jgi:hypothetical protein
MARENSGWGYTRIRGALHNIGYDIGRNTINASCSKQAWIPRLSDASARRGVPSCARIAVPLHRSRKMTRVCS